MGAERMIHASMVEQAIESGMAALASMVGQAIESGMAALAHMVG